jgi:hypothetical protein
MTPDTAVHSVAGDTAAESSLSGAGQEVRTPAPLENTYVLPRCPRKRGGCDGRHAIQWALWPTEWIHLPGACLKVPVARPVASGVGFSRGRVLSDPPGPANGTTEEQLRSYYANREYVI